MHSEGVTSASFIGALQDAVGHPRQGQVHSSGVEDGLEGTVSEEGSSGAVAVSEKVAMRVRERAGKRRQSGTRYEGLYGYTRALWESMWGYVAVARGMLGWGKSREEGTYVTDATSGGLR